MIAKKTDVKEFLLLLVARGETIDPLDMPFSDAWLYLSYLALEPFPSDHQKYRKRVFDSFQPPGKRIKTALFLLKSASRKTEGSFRFNKNNISADYTKLLKRFLQYDQPEMVQP
jgi:hypothetical protein